MTSRSKLNPVQTIIIPPGDVPWRASELAPTKSRLECWLQRSVELH
jgi:hypothetical protein